MKTRPSVMCVAITIVLIVGVTRHASLQSDDRLGTAPVTHVAVVVRDIDRSARAWADVLGLPTPEIRTAAIPLTSSGGTSVRAPIKVAFFDLLNFYIELNQPLEGPSPWSDHLDKYGPGMHHLGFLVRDALENKVARLEKTGGTLLAGTPGRFAFIDFRQRLGETFEVVQVLQNRPLATGGSILATTPVDHVGIAAVNVDVVSRAFADVLGVTAPPVSATRAGDTATKRAEIRQENVRLEFLEAVAPATSLAMYVVRQGGTALHHVSWNVGDQLTQTTSLLEGRGGKLLRDAASGDSVYLDFTDGDLGVVIGLSGTALR